MAIAALPEEKQLELTLLDLPWPRTRPQLRLVTDLPEPAGTDVPVELDPRLAHPAGISHRDEPPAPFEQQRRSGPSPRVRARRRQVVLAAAVVVTVVALLSGPVKLLGGSGGNPASASERALVSGTAPATSSLPLQSGPGEGSFYVAQTGDTLRSIAARIDPANPGVEAAGLAAELGSPVIVPGEHIPVS